MSLRLSGGRRLQSPPGATARPTAARVRQAVLNLLRAELPGSRWLDLCCGSGVMACEALQHGAAEVVAIERDRRVALVARANLEAVVASLGQGRERPRLRVIQADARRWLAAAAPLAGGDGDRPAAGEEDGQGGGRGCDTPPGSEAGGAGPGVGERPFDLIYCDPPWPAGLHGPLSAAVLRGGWIRAGGTLVWECPSDAVPAAPPGWQLRDQRRYGGSTLLLLTPA